MRPLIVFAIVLCYLFASLCANAYDQTFLLYGGGFSAPDQTHIGQVNVLAIGHQRNLFYNVLDYKLETGGWYDDTGHKGASNSFYGSASAGIDIDNDTLYANWFLGAGLITTPDSSLGGYFQFFHDAEVGIQGFSGKRLGVFFKHISDAGIESPNKGRNFAGIKGGLPF